MGISCRFTTVYYSSRSRSNHRTCCFNYQSSFLGPIQEYLAGLNAVCEGRQTKLILGVQRTLDEGDTLPRFLAAMAAPPEGTGAVLESDPSIREQLQQRGAVPGATEGHLTAGNGDATPVRQSPPPPSQPRESIGRTGT